MKVHLQRLRLHQVINHTAVRISNSTCYFKTAGKTNYTAYVANLEESLRKQFSNKIRLCHRSHTIKKVVMGLDHKTALSPPQEPDLVDQIEA